MRLSTLRERIVDLELDALIVSRPENIRYISGYKGEGQMIVTPERALIATDFRYYEQLAEEAPDFALVKVTKSFSKVLPDIVAALCPETIGFESHVVTHDVYTSWQKAAPDVRWTATKDVVETLRMTKDEEELAAIRQAVAIGDAAIAHLVEIIEPGMTEAAAAWELERYMRTHGSQAVSFPIIVGAGPRGALPHVVPSDRVIQPGEPIVIDMGCKIDGYCSDMTRTFTVGEPSDPERYHEVWNTVLEAQQAARKAIRPGMLGKEAHAVAQEIITDAGYGDYFGHGLGHGVGLAIHEKPSVGRTSEDTLRPGAVITVEPGIYIPDWGGVRIEDMGVVTEEGIEIFTKADKIAVVS
jgi:Xaa-Pro aminopeptidase